mmetsp:Transcript_27098/g.66823  ORF Transcript_27098/g.66823 Transcript_27098/m.66823 type:complete len:313 (-) Transcript_27098:19-957(-)|eukprot:CAMPEP_0206219510 /NCGR_PEP_ID=MMETSP0047_2-20121206/4354_1 /ASSEMBLY_ACC=CAM_ASM_000192 /TAXON_ID=195065 /ORGANISM="Chroomonas mesostigmatica_cf, Strain CCMP1168" /LENGTH=312 /DNA_ID=CAMNT_0053642051 /DNA_START=56 /DNA_END=994 /DNA_ORIENTATION=-
MASRVAFHDEYARVQASLKKRLFTLTFGLTKKPNPTESAEQLLELGNALKREGNAPYAAFCSMAVAQCCRSMRSTLKEAYYESEAGSMLWKAQEDDGEAVPLEDLVPEATNCYLAAIEAYMKLGRYSLASSLYSEMASHYLHMCKEGDAAVYFVKAAELVERDSPQIAAACLQESIQCRVRGGDYTGAIECMETTIEVLERHSSRGTWREAMSGMDFDKGSIAHLLLSQALLQTILKEFDAARRTLGRLEQHTEIHLPASQVHTILHPLLAAWVGAFQDGDRGAAQQIARELRPWIAPIHIDMLGRTLQALI